MECTLCGKKSRDKHRVRFVQLNEWVARRREALYAASSTVPESARAALAEDYEYQAREWAYFLDSTLGWLLPGGFQHAQRDWTLCLSHFATGMTRRRVDVRRLNMHEALRLAATRYVSRRFGDAKSPPTSYDISETTVAYVTRSDLFGYNSTGTPDSTERALLDALWNVVGFHRALASFGESHALLCNFLARQSSPTLEHEACAFCFRHEADDAWLTVRYGVVRHASLALASHLLTPVTARLSSVRVRVCAGHVNVWSPFVYDTVRRRLQEEDDAYERGGCQGPPPPPLTGDIHVDSVRRNYYNEERVECDFDATMHVFQRHRDDRLIRFRRAGRSESTCREPVHTLTLRGAIEQMEPGSDIASFLTHRDGVRRFFCTIIDKPWLYFAMLRECWAHEVHAARAVIEQELQEQAYERSAALGLGPPRYTRVYGAKDLLSGVLVDAPDPRTSRVAPAEEP